MGGGSDALWVPDLKKEQVGLGSQKNMEGRRETKMEKQILQKVGLELWNAAIGEFGSGSSKEGFSSRNVVYVAFQAFTIITWSI